MAKPALGRGLGALLGGNPIAKPPSPAPSSNQVPAPVPADKRDQIQRVPLDRIRPCPFQPRKTFTAEALTELADSIREQGIVQPLVVRENGGFFELIAGERRWRAAHVAGLGEVPIIIRKADDQEVLELALIENLQRENLNPMEEAQGYVQLIEQFHLKQEEVAMKVGKSRAAVANSLRLLKLSASLQDYLRQGMLSVGHAKVILSLNNEKQQKLAADRIIRESLNVRQTETLVSRLQDPQGSPLSKSGSAAAPKADAHVTNLENQLREKFGTKVNLRYRQGKGSLEVAFFSDAELERILQLVGISD
jgi:ParB family chromosome partitioning protein